MAKLVATSGIDRFDQAQIWIGLERSETVFDGMHAWVRCEVAERVPAGESMVYGVRVVAPSEVGDALDFHNQMWHRIREYSVSVGGKSM